MIEQLIAYSARNRFLVILLVLLGAGWGGWALSRVPLDALPDLSDVQVIVFTEWPGQSPDLVEDQVTYPIITTMLSAPKVKFVRGQSFFGLSFVYVIFVDGTDMYWARSRVLEYLNEVSAQLPERAQPILGPDATGVGWVFQYALVDTSGQNNLVRLGGNVTPCEGRLAIFRSTLMFLAILSIGGCDARWFQKSPDPSR